MPRSTFADLLRQHRTRLGWSLGDVAMTSGISRSHLGNLEQGRRAPSPDHVRALLAALRLTDDAASAFTVAAALAHVPEPLRRVLIADRQQAR